MRFGKSLTLTTDGTITRSVEKVFVDYATTKQSTLYTESVRVKDDADITGEFLKLMDRYKQGEIDLPGIQLFRDNNTGILRVEKTWVDREDLTYKHK